jgi:hypothetical protein
MGSTGHRRRFLPFVLGGEVRFGPAGLRGGGLGVLGFGRGGGVVDQIGSFASSASSLPHRHVLRCRWEADGVLSRSAQAGVGHQCGGRGGWREIWWPSTRVVVCGGRSGDSPSTQSNGGTGAGAEDLHGVVPRSTCHSGYASPFAVGLIFDSESRFRQWCALGSRLGGFRRLPMLFISTTAAAVGGWCWLFLR